MAGYEARRGQIEMAEAVAEAIAGEHHLVVEAGTGVGKSFAYLVPSILAAVESGGRVVVSTRTINLQEQLIEKDIPFLRQVMPVEFAAELVKGRSNYLSLRRLGVALGRGTGLLPTLDDLDHLDRLAKWSKQTKLGSRSELAFRPTPDAWSAVESDNGNCLGKKCPSYRDCFYYKAIRRAKVAHVLVVNHALYMSDLSLRRSGFSLLPEHDVVIFDEAHGLPEVAASHLGVRVSSGVVTKLLGKLASEKTTKGLLSSLGLAEEVEAVRQARLAALQFFGGVSAWRKERPNGNGRVHAPSAEPDALSQALWQLAARLRAAAQDMESADLRMEVEAAAAKCDQTAGELRGWLEQRWSDAVYWVEAQGDGRAGVTLAGAPLDVGSVLREELLETTPTCVFTSATMSTGAKAGRFAYFRREVGLRKGEEREVESPFDYPNQAVLHLARGLPDPASDSLGFERAAIRALPRVIGDSGGHALVLFTSYRMLEQAARELAPWFARAGLKLLVHGGEKSRGQLLEEFKHDPSSVLFGADSFWEGVDVPGEALSHLIITRLPFRVPTDPVQEARKERVERAGGRWFDDYTVPEAVLKLKQGFGRLIRSASDKGRVTILDPRVLTKGYGKRFLEALPECRRVVEDFRGMG
jgi:ATP-dependent DNA helicase DinG